MFPSSRKLGRFTPPWHLIGAAGLLCAACSAGLDVSTGATGSDTNAITNGQPDGARHPEVGALLAAQAFSDGTWAECSGTLIAPRVFLTAAHCTHDGDRVAVTFATSYQAGTSAVHWGTWHVDPNYVKSVSAGGGGDPDDLAVVVLDQAVSGISPARLPAANSLDGLDGSAWFTPVGYGGQAVTNGAGGKVISYQDVRYFAVGTLNSETESWFHLSQNASTGNGGTCYGDSGGPNFRGAARSETNVVAAVTETGDAYCRSTNVAYRLDKSAPRAFLGQYVTLP